jgi:adenylate cyclase
MPTAMCALDMGNKVTLRPQNEFKKKMVIIGSITPNLFDIKATPIDSMFPGVAVLATAMGNFKHDNFEWLRRKMSHA